MNLIYILVVGGIAGYLASTFMKGKGMGIIMNILLGILGAVVGAFILPKIGINLSGPIGAILNPTLGAIIVLFFAKILAK